MKIVVCFFVVFFMIHMELQIACAKANNYEHNPGHEREISPLRSRLIESMMGLRPRQGNLRLVLRLFSLMRGLPSIRLK